MRAFGVGCCWLMDVVSELSSDEDIAESECDEGEGEDMRAADALDSIVDAAVESGL